MNRAGELDIAERVCAMPLPKPPPQAGGGERSERVGAAF
jgi:hypothetical protein